jgi:hypothetical protein
MLPLMCSCECARRTLAPDACTVPHVPLCVWSQYGWTPLHFAALGGCSEMVALLIDQGADLTARDIVSGWGLSGGMNG